MTDLSTEFKLGRARPRRVLDITRLAPLREIRVVAGELHLGAAVTFTALRQHPLVREHAPALAQAAAEIGAVAIQNRATLGGNLLGASPAADAPPVLLALGARLRLASHGATREVALDDFYPGYRETVRRPDELLTTVILPCDAGCAAQAFYKLGTRRAQAISKVCLGARAEVTSAGIIRRVRLAAGSVGPTVIRLTQTEAYLAGQRLTDADCSAIAAQAAATAQDEVAPIDDVRSTAAYRQVVMGRLVSRFLLQLQAGEI